jgi:hypothetical protein
MAAAGESYDACGLENYKLLRGDRQWKNDKLGHVGNL